MKTIITLIITIVTSFNLFGQSQADTSKSIVIQGEIKSIQYLIKDYTSESSKNYPVYWVEISLKIEKASVMDQPFFKNMSDPVPETFTFTTNSSGLKSDMDKYDHFKTGEKVFILAQKKQVIRFIKKEIESIAILSIE